MKTVRMSGTWDFDEEEPMDYDWQDGMASSEDKQDKDAALLTLSLKWPQSDQPPKPKTTLERLLQSWFNQRKKWTDCSVENIQKDGTALIKVSPSPALSELRELKGRTVSTKDGKVTILSISLGSPNQASQGSDDESTNVFSSVQEPQAAKVQDEEQSHPVGKDNDRQRKSFLEAHKKPSDDCLVSVDDYWYMNHIYKDEIKCIMKKNKVRIKANVNVKFEADQEDGNPEGALSEFANLVRSSLPNSEDSVIPLKFVDPDQWSDAMRVMQENKSKLLLTLSCEEVTLCGPSQSQDAFSAALNAMQKRNASPKENKPAPRNTALRTEMAIKDPFTHLRLNTKESHLKPRTTSVDTPANARDKFVVFPKAARPKRESDRQKASTLYRMTTTSWPSLLDSNVLPETQGSSTQHHSAALARDGATAGDKQEDICPICLSPFISNNRSGLYCPLCEDLFSGMGDQPDGTMAWSKCPMPLPGFSYCGHTLITYDIPSGLQTNKHPNPGQPFHGTRRSAYLPDNKKGNKVLRLLKQAFDRKLIFTVGTSRTTGAENQVTWSDVSHKTSMTGGPESFGYPDPNYLKRVKLELKAKGIQ